MSSSPDDSLRRDDPAVRREGRSQDIAADLLVDSLLRDASAHVMRQPDLALLFSDDAIDCILRDVPCRMTSVQPVAPDRGRRIPVDLNAFSTGFGRLVTNPAVQLPSRQRRLVRSVILVARDALSVTVVLSLVVATFAASVLTSRWLSDPGARIASKRPHGIDFAVSARVPGDSVVTIVPDRQPSGTLAGTVEDGNPSGSSIPAAGDAESAADASTAGPSPGDGLHDRRIAADGPAADPPFPGPDESPLELRAAPIRGAEVGLQAGGPGRKASRPAGDSLRVVAARPAIRRSVPYHRGYDLAFEMTRGEAPFVDPSLTPALAVDHPPLSRRTDSFDRVEHLMAAGGLRRDRLQQAIGGLRVEEVLAALPAPKGSVSPAAVPAVKPAAVPAVHLAGGPSISGRQNSRLLEVSVAAPASSLRSRPSGNLVFVLDASAAAGADEAWPAVCRGVDDTARRLDPAALITVVLFAERPVVIASNVPVRDLLAIRRRLLEIRPRGGGDLHGCMEMVRGMMAEWQGPARCVVVAHAGSIARAERDGDPDLAAWRRSQQVARDGDASAGEHATAAVGLRDEAEVQPAVSVVEIDAVSGATGEQAEGIGISLVDGVGLDSVLIRRSIVAAAMGDGAAPRFEGCRLEVAFDPSQVAAYRLVGHRRQVIDMTSSRSSAVDLADGECVRAVYEVVLREKSPRGQAASSSEAFVARATCRYRRHGDSADSSVVVGISGSQLAADPAAGDHEGRAVWLAVAVAELAAGSAHVESPQRLRDAVRLRIERAGDALAGLPDDDPSAEAGSMLRRLYALWATL